jgi:uncharacterized protein
MLLGVRVILGGGTGFLGGALRRHLRDLGHDVAILTRRPSGAPDQIQWHPDGSAGPWTDALNGAAAIVNLAGEGIADRRWTEPRKAALRDSRLQATRSLVAAIARLPQPPAVLVNASGIGYYGDRGAETVTEATPPGTDFLGQLCVEWESEAEQASSIARVVIVRSGIVLHPSGGALGRMLLPFRLGVGGRIGSGAQYLPWIHREDWLRLVAWMLGAPDARGAFNAAAPIPSTNAEFTKALGRALRRPTLLPVPAFGLRLALGELAETLLTGQRAIPQRAQEQGFVFRFPEINPALADLLGRPEQAAEAR